MRRDEEKRVVSAVAQSRDSTRCHGSDHQQPIKEGAPTKKATSIPYRRNTQITPQIYPHQRTNVVIAFAILFRTIPAISVGLLHEPARRVTIYI